MKKPAAAQQGKQRPRLVRLSHVLCVHMTSSCNWMLTQARAAAPHDALADDPDLHALVTSQETTCSGKLDESAAHCTQPVGCCAGPQQRAVGPHSPFWMAQGVAPSRCSRMISPGAPGASSTPPQWPIPGLSLHNDAAVLNHTGRGVNTQVDTGCTQLGT